MLVINCREYLDRVRTEASSMGVSAALEGKLLYLSNLGASDGAETKCYLYHDFAPLSFTFTIQRKKGDVPFKPWMHGGLIFYKGQESGADAPQYSVSLSTDEGPRWEVHT